MTKRQLQLTIDGELVHLLHRALPLSVLSFQRIALLELTGIASDGTRKVRVYWTCQTIV